MGIPFLPLPAINGFSVHKKPVFASVVRTASSGLEVRAKQQTYPLWEFELTFETLRDETQNAVAYSELVGFHAFRDLCSVILCVGGQYAPFYYEDPTDNSRTGQFLGTGDGATLNFFFVRTIGGAPTRGTQIVGAVNIGHTVNVYLDGVLLPQVGNWALGTDAVSLEFVVAPGSGVVITTDFWFFYKCRFITDDVDFEEFFKNRHTVKALRFRSLLSPDPALAVGYGPIPGPEPPPPSTGNYYFEIIHNASASWGRVCIGFCNAGFNLVKPQPLDLSAGPYASLNGGVFATLQNPSNSTFWGGQPGALPPNIGSVSYSGTTPVIGVAVNTTVRESWFRDASGAPGTWVGLPTGSGTPDPATGVRGYPFATSVITGDIFILAGLSHESGNSGTVACTLNAGASAFAAAAPTGFSAWDTTGATTFNPADMGGTDIVLSGGNLILSAPNPGWSDANGPAEYVRSTTSKV